jgi:C6 transcription factor Pro1
MDMDPHNHLTVRSANPCWTCRVRRKRCDKRQPVCEACALLFITCHTGHDKPVWMDGGVQQEEMVERLKREVKDKAHWRRAVHTGSGQREYTVSATEPITSESICKRTGKKARESVGLGRSDTILIMFYLEHLLPFMFPFYRPPLLQGGRAWILEMMISSPVIRQATLCQSSYFFSLARGTAVDHDVAWETVLAQAKDAFEMLRRALQVIDGSEISEHLDGAVRIMASIMQVQRFEVAVLSLNNCQAHLNAALALFKQLLSSVGAVDPAVASSSFNAVLKRLGPASWVLPAQNVQVPSAEQAAFSFSSALLILDDIIASTMLQEEPRLYEYHHSLLNGANPAIDLGSVVGCQNWALLEIGAISILDAWKQRCKRAGNLDVMELVHRATAIKLLLEAHLAEVETHPMVKPKQTNGLLDAFAADYGLQSITPSSQVLLVTRVWVHAALIYLSVVVSGWQPASLSVCYHVGQVIDLLSNQISPPELIRTMVWPFCVAGCLAEPAQEPHFRRMVEALQPPSIFGTARKALEIMELVWNNRDAADATSRDLGTIFRSQGDLVLLV